MILLSCLCIVVFAFSSSLQAGGHLKIAVTSNLNTLDPHKSKIGDEYLYMFAVFNGLTFIDRDLTLKPELAKRWESSEDLKTWTFYLREGVKFHHGRELDAEDVVVTINRILDPEIGSKARVNFLVVDKVEAVDKYTVRFHLNTPYAGFAEVLGERQARIIPRDRIDQLATEPSGTGPFIFKSFMPGDRVELAKNPNYFEAGEPLLDAVNLQIIPESTARVTALETGDINVVWHLPLETIERLEKNPDITVDEVPTASWDGIIFHNKMKPFDNLQVRQAIHLAIDKEKMAEIVLFGHGTPTHSPIPPSHPFFNKEISFKTDLAKARALLAEAGYPKGFEVKMYVPEGRPARERLGITVREMLKPLGIKVDIQRVPWDKFITEIEGKAISHTDGFYSRPTVDTSLYPWYHSLGSWNDDTWHYKNTKVDQLLDKARQTRNDEERKKVYMEFQRMVVEEPPGVIPYVINHVNAYHKTVKGLHSSPMMYLDLRKVTITE
jgi:peptide/nickel transport system substrate-binding protein